MSETLGFDPHDPGRRAHYGEFYGLHELPDLPLLLVHGNCQAESLRVLLHAAGQGAWHGVRIPPVHELTEEDLPHLHRILARCGVVVTQPIAAGYRGLALGSEEILARTPRGCAVVKFPVLRWTALMPTLAIVRAEGVTDPPIAPYHDLRVLVAAAQQKTSVELKPVSAEAVRVSRDESLRQLRTRQEAHNTVDAASVFEAAGADAAYVINHPTNRVLRGVADAILGRLGVSAVTTDPGRVLLGGIRAPVAASTLDALGYDRADLADGPREHWIIGGKRYSQEYVAQEHLRWYQKYPQVVTAGMKRHGQLIAAMGLLD